MSVLKDPNVPKAKEVSPVATEGQEEKSFVEKIMEARQKAAEKEAEMQAVLDIVGGGKDKSGGGSDVATAIVTSSMKQQEILMNALQTQISEANKQLTEARIEREKAQTDLFNERVIMLKAEKEKLDEAAEAAKGAGAPKSQIEVYKEVRQALSDEIGELAKVAPKDERPQGVSEQTQIALKKMEMDQTRILAEMEAARIEAERRFSLEIRKFDEEAKRRWAEYTDNKRFREEGIAGAQDILAAIGDGISRERGGVATKPGQKPGEGQGLEARIRSFPCSQCQEKVEIEPGAKFAVCPGCQAEYEILGAE